MTFTNPSATDVTVGSYTVVFFNASGAVTVSLIVQLPRVESP